ncbi:hypothetical protein AB3R30_07600 [Leptolyngbyaceae cyanobacterium UHCC 1019]
MAELHPGWLIPDLITLDDEYQGRYTLWRNTLETGNATANIPQTTFLSIGDAGFDKGLAMLTTCLDAIPPNGLSASHTLPYLIDWLLFALGHPSTPQCPSEPHGCPGASDRLLKTFELELLLRCPADYFGHLLAVQGYGQSKRSSTRFYPTFPRVARAMATASVATAIYRSQQQPPFHAVDPCIGTGRLCLELSNTCRSLTGWERDPFLLATATVNFLLYAPDFALPIPQLGGDLIVGDALSGLGRSFLYPERIYDQCPVATLPALSPTLRSSKSSQETNHPAGSAQLSLF